MPDHHANRRRACVLLPLFSIRAGSPDRPGGGWGTGEIPDIAHFARWAGQAGFRILQLLPVNEVCGGESSPYAAASAFALDPVYLGLDDCEDFRLAGGRASLSDDDRRQLDELASRPTVDWGAVRRLKHSATQRAFDRFVRDEWKTGSARAVALNLFRQEHRAWLEDYALFSVLHDRFQKSWVDWPEGLRDRMPAALESARGEHEHALLYRSWVQWQLDVQWRKARQEAREAGVELMGDLPFVVSGDSADVWSRRDDFRVDLRVGTPPDAFSETGQDWGLPVYDWEAIADNEFAWLRARAARSGELFALYRVDHVIGLYRTYYRSGDGSTSGFTPAAEPAQIALGERIIRILQASGEVVAEDLGMVPDFLRPSLTALNVPGYKVLRWEKYEQQDGPRRRDVYSDPATWPELSVAASGTHDIEPNAEWWDALPATERTALLQIPGLAHLRPDQPFDDQVRDALLRVLYAAPSEIVAIPLQDALGGRERVNVPGTVADTNWTYRMTMDVGALQADAATTSRLAQLAGETNRR